MAGSAVVGREEELAFLEQRLDALAESGSGAVILEGDAGIGKTVLLSSGVASASRRRYRVLSCGPAPSEVQLSYAALGDLLEDVASETLGTLPEPQRQALEVALGLRGAGAAGADPRTTALAVLNVFRELARWKPLVVAVDDAQWLDEPTAAALAFAVRRLESEPLLLIVALRRESQGVLALDLERARMDGGLARLEVGPLSADSLHRLVRDRLGHTLSRPDVVRLGEASRGNPFYALELARVLQRRQSLQPSADHLPVPRTLDGLVDERLEGLVAPVRRVLELAAALSAPTAAMVAAASEGEAEISAALEAAVAASVIELDGEQIRFVHPLYAAGIYSKVAPARRRGMHRRLAAIVGDPESRARHLALATEGPDDDVAAACEEAARAASARGASEAAAELCERAILLTPSGRMEDLRARKLAAVGYHLTSGDRERAHALLGTLREELPPGRDRAEVLLLLGRVTHDLATQLQFLEQAKSEAIGDKQLLSRIHHTLGAHWGVVGDAPRNLASLRTALAFADECGDQGAIVAAITDLIMAEPSTGSRTPGLLERALALRPGADEPVAYSLHASLALIRLYQGHLDEARALSETMLTDAVARGNEWNRMSALRIRALVECRAGEWNSAARDAGEASALMLQISGHQQPATLYAKALVDAHLGRVEAARRTAEEGLELSERAQFFHGRIQHSVVLGFLELSRGRADAAARIFRPLVADVIARGWALELHFPSGEPIEAFVATGELQLARELLGRFEREGAVVESPWIEAAAERCRGLLLAAEGNLSEAQAAFERALVIQQNGRWPFEQARTLLALGQTQRRAKHRRAARESLEAALTLFERLKAPLWAEQTRAELARIGGRAPAGGALTPVEERIAALVAQGHTNKEAAAALYLSRHTIEGHLSRIYAKLGVRSRTELAHRLADGASVARDT